MGNKLKPRVNNTYKDINGILRWKSNGKKVSDKHFKSVLKQGSKSGVFVESSEGNDVTDNSVNSNILKVCHASESVVKIPSWNYINPKNPRKPEEKDFGLGFYMCKSVDQFYPIGLYAGFNVEKVILHEFELDLIGLRKLCLSTNLAWVLVIAAHRHESAGRKSIEKKQWKLLRYAILQVVRKFDIVIGPISDDDIYTALDDFVDNRVSEEYLIESVNYMKYPIQLVSKSERTDKQLKYVTHREVSNIEIRKAREQGVSAKAEMKMSITERRRIERNAVANGNFRGKLFKDLVSEFFVDIKGDTDKEKMEDLIIKVRGWIEDDAG